MQGWAGAGRLATNLPAGIFYQVCGAACVQLFHKANRVRRRACEFPRAVIERTVFQKDGYVSAEDEIALVKRAFVERTAVKRDLTAFECLVLGDHLCLHRLLTRRW